jgi:hypothetical protein
MKINKLVAVLLTVIIIVSLVAISAAQQETFRVGDEVDIRCRHCSGGVFVEDGWIKGRIEAIQQNGMYKVRYANKQSTVIVIQNSPDYIRAPKDMAKIKAQNDLRSAFHRETYPRYYESVRSLMMIHDSNLVEGNTKYGPPPNDKDWEPITKDLAALDNLCKTKYAGMTNNPDRPRENELVRLPATWCAIAANRVEYEKRGRSVALRSQFLPLNVEGELKAAMTNEDNRTPDEAQAVLYNRAKWQAERTAEFQPRFAAMKTEIPADLFADAFAKADELKVVIEKTAPHRSWTQPTYTDAAVESFIKTKFASAPEFKGAKVVKIGLDYTTWKKRESLSYVASDSKYAYYKVEYNSYKRGVALVKMPGHPFCQAREWIVGKGAKGIVLVSLGGAGIFMKCQ